MVYHHTLWNKNTTVYNDEKIALMLAFDINILYGNGREWY